MTQVKYASRAYLVEFALVVTLYVIAVTARPYLAGLSKAVANFKLTTTDVVRLSPDYIREIGVASFDTRGDKPVSVKSTYVVVWKRVGGAWKLWTDIFH